MFNLESVFYNAAEIFFRFIGLVPRKSAIRIAGFLGKVLFLVDSKHRKIALDNLMYAFGHQKSRYEIRFLAKQVFINLVFSDYRPLSRTL